MATAQKIVAIDRPAGSYSLMYGTVRIDVSKKPLFDTLDKTRPERHNYCPEHNEQLKSSFYCTHGKGHYINNGDTLKGVDVDGTIVEFTDAEVASLQSPRDGIIEMVALLDWLDPVYFTNSWIIWPKDVTWAESFKLIFTTLQAYDSMLLGVVVEEGTPRIIVIRVAEIDGVDVMVAQLCHHQMALRAEMVHKIALAIEKIPDSKKEHLKIAHQVLDTLPTEMTLDNVKDEFGQAMYRYLRAKVSKKEFKREELKTKETTFEEMMKSLEKTVSATASTRQKKGTSATSKQGTTKRPKAKA